MESFGFGLTDPRAIEILLPDGVAMLAVHPLSPSSEFRAEQNDRQLQFAADWAADQDGPTIVVGDFNATPWSYPFRRLMSSTDLSNSARGFGLDLSYPADGNPLLAGSRSITFSIPMIWPWSIDDWDRRWVRTTFL